MTKFARRGHHDGNHSELTKAFESLGCTVADTSAVGFGFPDICVGLVGLTYLVEIKDENGRLSESQERFIRDWRGGRIAVMQTTTEAIEFVQRVRKAVGDHK